MAGGGLYRGAAVAWGIIGVLWAATSPAAPTPAELGWRLVERGDYHEALRRFEQARTSAPGDRTVLVGLGLTYHLVGDTERAIEALERAMHAEGTPHDAQALLGDLYMRQGELERAIHYYRMAIQREADNPGLRTKLARARRAYQAQLEYDRLFSPHFVIYYHPDRVASNIIHHVADRLERLYQEIGDALAFYPTSPFSVIVYGGPDFWDRTESPTWVRGLYDGTIHLPLALGRSPVLVPEGLLRHEYTHAAVDRLSAGRVPVWLSEGLALHFEDPHRRVEPVPDGTVDGKAPLPLQTEFVSLAPVDAGAAYAHSYRATSHLIRRHGLRQIRALLVEVAHHEAFSRAFAEVLGTGYPEFERRWLGSAP